VTAGNSPVLQVISDTDARGAQTFAINLAAALAGRGRPVTTVALAPGRYGGIAVPTLGRRPRGLGTLVALRRRAGRARVVIAHGSTTLSASALSMTGLGLPFVYRVIGDPSWWAARGWRRRYVGLLMRRAARVVVLDPLSATVVTSQHGVPSDRVAVVPNGVPADRFPPATPSRRAAARQRLELDNDAVVVAYLGALGPEKNLPAAIEAVAQLGSAILVLAGSGPEASALAALAARRAPGRVRFLGTTTNPSEVLTAADVLVLSSWTEGMPAVAIEAGLTGIPAVATDVGAVGEVIVSGDTGLLVPPGNPTALAAALGEALRSAHRLGEAARARCLSKFTIDAVAAAWDGVIESVTDRS
jgi:glycosyltransferase involved in cell wall biosynthesis